MKKNFLTAVAVMVSGLFIGSAVAEAVSVKMGGQLRPRAEWNDRDFDDSTDSGFGVSTRIRLNATADITPDTSAFIQLQSVDTWGDSPGAFSNNDTDSSVGVHQAYFTVKNVFTLPIDVKVGRQEVVLDGHRLLGNTGWTQGAQTHDAVRIQHSAGNHTLAYVYSLAQSSIANPGEDTDDGGIGVHVLYGQMKGILGGALSAYFVAVTDECNNHGSFGNSCNHVNTTGANENDFYTVGARQAGQLYGIDYRGEFYYQFGDANEAGFLGPGGAVVDNERDAYMFGARIGKKFNNVMWKPSITVWYDYLSGTDDDDVASEDFASFDTLFDTGHKFYGLMDQFTGVGRGGNSYMGLQDLAIKASISPMAKTTLKADFHFFYTATDPEDAAFALGANSLDSDLGEELDITLVHKYNSNLTLSLGYSVFWTDDTFHAVNENGSNPADPDFDDTIDWLYVQADLKF